MTNSRRHVSVMNRDALPSAFPTHIQTPEFWEQLGRVVGTFGALEEVMGKAIFALTGSMPIDIDTEGQSLTAWQDVLERALTDPLNPLIDTFGRALRDHRDVSLENPEDLLDALHRVAELRNVLCHGSWQAPDEHGRSKPLFVDRKLRVFDTPVDVEFLQRTQRQTRELICEVIDTVTRAGLQFPGSDGPGMRLW